MHNEHYLLEELSNALHCDTKLDKYGVVEITIENKIPLIIEFNEELNVFILNIPLAKIENVDDSILSSIMYQLLCGNYMWPSAGATISIDQYTNIICLHRMVELPVDKYAYFENIVLSMASAAEYWIEYIEKMQEDAQNTEFDLSNALRI